MSCLIPAAALLFAFAYQDLHAGRARAIAWTLAGLSAVIHAAGVFARDSARHARHYIAPLRLDLFSLSDNQIGSSFAKLWDRLAGLCLN